jgi:hypothetical protein
VSVSRRAAVRGAVAVLAALNVANVVNIVVIERGHWLLMAVERNPSTWFASALLAATALLAWAVGRGTVEPGSWNLVAAVLLLMSVDEVATFHEKLGGVPGVPHLGSRAWIGAGLVVSLLVGARLLPWVMSLPLRLRVAVLQSATLFLAGAVGVEWVAGAWAETHGDDRVFFAISTVEENLELLAVLLLADRLLGYAASLQAALRLEVVDPGSRPLTAPPMRPAPGDWEPRWGRSRRGA